MATKQLTTKQLILMTHQFITDAIRDGRTDDVAYGNGALDALLGKKPNGKPFDENHSTYISGWCTVHGI